MKALMTLTFMVTTSFHAKSALKLYRGSTNNNINALEQSAVELNFQTCSLHFHAIKTYDFCWWW